MDNASLKNSESKYGSISKFFHWVTAFLILGIFLLGLYMGDMPKGELKVNFYMVHKSFGVTIIFITLLRLLWFAFSKRPLPEKNVGEKEIKIFKLIILAFYFLLFAVPFSGWLFSSFAGYPVDFFGLFDIPNFIEKNKSIAEFIHEIHETLAFSIISVAGLHTLAALRHHFMLKDGVLKRMLPW